MLLKDLQTLATKLATGTLFHVEKAGKAYSVDYSALAKAIIEEYADSTVGGSKQSVQAAIAALNSRLNNNGAWNELLGGKSQNGDYTLNDSYAGYKSVVVMLFGSGSSIASCIYPTTMLITAGYHPVVEMDSYKVDIVFTSSTNVKVSGLNGSVRIYGIR